jgi:transketolase
MLETFAVNQIEERDRRLELREDIEVLFQTQRQSQENWETRFQQSQENWEAKQQQMQENWETRLQQSQENWEAKQQQIQDDWETRLQQFQENWEVRRQLTQAQIEAVSAQIASLMALSTADRAQIMADRAAEAQARADFIAQMVGLQTEVRNILQELADLRRQQTNGNS